MFQKYKYVLAVYEEHCFTKAAKRLFISQPSLSVAIQNIEKKVGMPLFERSGTALRLTEAGEAYLDAARKIQYAEDAFTRQLEDLNDLHTGKLVVGGSNYLSSDVLPQLISQFRIHYPGVEISLIEANSTHLREMLDCEEVDLVIDNFEDYPELYERFPLVEERILMCVPTHHEVNLTLKAYQLLPEHLYRNPNALEQLSSLEPAVFREEPFVLLKSGNDMFDRACQIFESCGIVPNVVFHVDQLNISYALAESGVGACFLTDTFFRYRRHIADVVLYKTNHRLASRPLHIVHKKGRYCTKAMREFIKLTQNMIQ